VVAAVHEQVDLLWHTSVTAYHPKMIEAAAALVSIMPPSLDQVFFTNSGAEAVEGAIKLARRATGRSDIIAFVGAFHGRTYGALSLTASKSTYRRGMGPLLPGIHHIRYPYCFRYCTHSDDDICELVERELQLLFATTTAPETVAAIIVEPVQGEGGYVVPPPTFMPMLRRACDEHGIMLIADEVQSGFRPHRQDVRGQPHARRARHHVPRKSPGQRDADRRFHLGTSVNERVPRKASTAPPMAANAVSLPRRFVAVIETMTRDHIPERAERLGRHVMERARGWQADIPSLADVRGLRFDDRPRVHCRENASGNQARGSDLPAMRSPGDC